MLFSSGLIAGASVAGMTVALLQLSDTTRGWLNVVNFAARLGALADSDLFAFALFLGLSGILWLVAIEKVLAPKPEATGAAK